jgi:hypothetical protein
MRATEPKSRGHITSARANDWGFAAPSDRQRLRTETSIAFARYNNFYESGPGGASLLALAWRKREIVLYTIRQRLPVCEIAAHRLAKRQALLREVVTQLPHRDP